MVIFVIIMVLIIIAIFIAVLYLIIPALHQSNDQIVWNYRRRVKALVLDHIVRNIAEPQFNFVWCLSFDLVLQRSHIGQKGLIDQAPEELQESLRI